MVKLYLLLISFAVCCAAPANAQKKKEIRKLRIRSVIVTKIERGNVIYDVKEFYNAAGEKIQELNYDSIGNYKGSKTFKYNSEGNQIEETTFSTQGEIVEKTTFVYNSKNQKTKEIVTDKNNTLLKSYEFMYNANGLKIEKRHYNAANKLVSTKQYVYHYR